MNEHIVYKAALNSLKYTFEDFGLSKTFKYNGDPNNFTRTYKSQIGNLIKLAFETEAESSSINLINLNKNVTITLDRVLINIDGRVQIESLPRTVNDLEDYQKSAYKFFLFVNYPMFFGIQNMSAEEFNEIKRAKSSTTHSGKITLEGYDIWYRAIGGDSFKSEFAHHVAKYSALSHDDVRISNDQIDNVLQLIYVHNFIIDDYEDIDIPKLKLFFDVANLQRIKNEGGLTVNGSAPPLYRDDILSEMNLNYAVNSVGEIPYADPNFGYYIYEGFNYDLVLNSDNMKCHRIDYMAYGFDNYSTRMGIGYKNLIRTTKFDYYESEFSRDYSESPLLQKLFVLSIIALNFALLFDSPASNFDKEKILKYYNQFSNNISCKNFYIARGNFGQYKNRLFVSNNPSDAPANLSWDSKFYDTTLFLFSNDYTSKFFIVNKTEDIKIGISRQSGVYDSISISREDYLNPDKLTPIIKNRTREILNAIR